MSEELRADPFPLTPAVGHYVPRPATETALGALASALELGAPVVELDAAPGLGKTLLLHLLADRLPDTMHAVYLPYPKLAEDGFWAWVASQLELRGNPLVAVLRHANELDDEGRALVLLVDDAAHLPSDTRAALVQAAAGGRGVRVVLGGIDPHSEPAGERVTLSESMTRAETEHYLQSRLAAADLPEHVRARFDDDTLGRLHTGSEGNPARLHLEAAELVRRSLEAGPTAETEAPAQKPARPMTDREAIAAIGAQLANGERPLGADSDATPSPSAPTQAHDLAEAHEPPAPIMGPKPTAEPVWRRALDGVIALGARVPERAAWATAGLAAGLALGVVGGGLLSTNDASEPELRAAPGLSHVEPVAVPELAPRVEPPAAGAPDVAAPPPEEPVPEGPALTLQPAPLPEVDPTFETAATIGRLVPLAEPEAATAEEPEPAPEAAAVSQVEPEPARVHLNVNATPWATITLDGETIGETPLGEIPIQPGPHALRATLPDGTVLEKTIEAADEDLFLVFP